jgi:hypothetical protein
VPPHLCKHLLRPFFNVRPSSQVTGQLGEVMHESTKIAYTLARNFLNTRIIGHRDNAFLATQQVKLVILFLLCGRSSFSLCLLLPNYLLLPEAQFNFQLSSLTCSFNCACLLFFLHPID